MSKLEKNIEEKAIRLYKEGHKVKDIIKALKIGNTTLFRILKRNKINTRISPFKEKTSREKICHQCRKSFSKTDKESYKQFYMRRFCSRKCNSLSLTGIKRGIIPRSAFRKGSTPWNKGIPHLVGEKNPNWKPKIDTKCATCGKQIKLHPYRLKGVKANYCSRKCTILSQEMPQFNTEPERILKKELIKSGFKENEDFIHQYNLFNKFRCDFAFPKEKVIIEVQGDFWHANPIKYPHNPENPKGDLHPIQVKGLSRDKSKFAYIKKRGWSIFPIWEFDIRHNQNRKVIIEAIKYFLSTKAAAK